MEEGGKEGIYFENPEPQNPTLNTRFRCNARTCPLECFLIFDVGKIDSRKSQLTQQTPEVALFVLVQCFWLEGAYLVSTFAPAKYPECGKSCIVIPVGMPAWSIEKL